MIRLISSRYKYFQICHQIFSSFFQLSFPLRTLPAPQAYASTHLFCYRSLRFIKSLLFPKLPLHQISSVPEAYASIHLFCSRSLRFITPFLLPKLPLHHISSFNQTHVLLVQNVWKHAFQVFFRRSWLDCSRLVGGSAACPAASCQFSCPAASCQCPSSAVGFPCSSLAACHLSGGLC